MEKNRRTITILIIFSLISGISGILQNIASGLLPESWHPYLWIAWPLFVIFMAASIYLAIAQLRADVPDQAGKRNENPTAEALTHIQAGLHLVQRELELQSRDYEVLVRKPLQRLVNGLTWSELRNISRKITQGSMSRVANRYNTQLYQPRQDLQVQFQAFLDSEKVCFVLVGSSGVGKSNFLLALDDPQQELFPDICPIVLDGAALNPKVPIATMLAQGFEVNLNIDHSIDVWREIQQINGIEEHKVVICIDAINENPDAPRLLKQIDELVRTASWPWIKIVITSRPQAWRLIKSSVLLGESRYFQPQVGESIRDTDFFIASAELLSFNQEELRTAYERYQEEYKLATDFDSLSPGVVLALCDPLILRLEAQMHHHGRIPPDIKIREVIRDYIHYLVIGDSATQRLTEKDVRFLQEELMPIMIQKQVNKNAIRVGNIPIANQLTGQRSVYSEAWILGEAWGRESRPNNSFTNLIDAQILTLNVHGENYQISFAYERYWDYFGGIRLYDLARESSSPAEKYGDIVDSIRQYPFMWGVLLEAMNHVLETGDEATLIALAGKNNQDARDLAVTALIDYADTNIDLVRQILKSLAPDWATRIMSEEEENRALAAIEIAGYLKDEKVLEPALGASRSRLQDHAVIATYRLWCEDRERGFRILERIIGAIRLRSLVFDRGRVLSAVSLTLLIYFIHYQDMDKPGQLTLDIWKSAILRILFYNPNAARSERLRSLLRNRLIKIVALGINSFLASVPNRYLVISLPELKAYYHLPDRVKTHALTLIPYLEAGKHDREAFTQALDKLFSIKSDGNLTNNMMLKLIVDYCLVSWGLEDLDVALEITQAFADKELERPEPAKRIMWDKSWVYAALGMVRPDGFSDNAMENYTGYVRRCYKEVRQWRGTLGSYAYLGYSDYAYTFLQIYQQTEVPLLRELLEWAVARGEFQKVLDILEEMGYMAGSHYWTAMLNIIEPVLEYARAGPAEIPKVELIEKVVHKLVDILSAAYHRHPNEVETYMHQQNLPKTFREQVGIRKPEERIAGDLLKGGLGAWGKFEVNQGFSPRGRPIMIWVFRNALTAKSFDQFIVQVSKGAINLITGEDVFTLDNHLEWLLHGSQKELLER